MATDNPNELDLSFLDAELTKFDQQNMRQELDRITEAMREAIATIEGEVAYKDFWTGKGVNWKDTRAGISNLGSMLQEWLAKQEIIENFDHEAYRYEPLPQKTQEFISSTRIILELCMALGAILATREVDRN